MSGPPDEAIGGRAPPMLMPKGHDPGRLRMALVSDTAVARGAVYGLRVRSFAGELAARGHQVVVLSPAVGSGDDIAEDVPRRLARHAWDAPLVLKRLALPPGPSRLPAPLRKAVTAWDLARHGGTDRGWGQAGGPLAAAVADLFRPDVVWATLGTTSNLALAQALARRAHAPWVADLKDNVDVYLPRGVRRLLAWRFADLAGATANAALHADAARRWLRRDVAVIRSGVAPGMAAPAGSRPTRDAFFVTLVGSVYATPRCDAFFAAFKSWTGRLPPAMRARVRFRYAGVAPDPVRWALTRHPPAVAWEVTGNVDHAALAALCQGAAVNCYLWSPLTFHHKALELLACRRPVVAFPGEHAETLELAARTGGRLTPCGDAGALAAALDDALARWRSGGPMPDFEPGPLTWAGQADRLEAVLRTAAGA